MRERKSEIDSMRERKRERQIVCVYEIECMCIYERERKKDR